MRRYLKRTEFYRWPSRMSTNVKTERPVIEFLVDSSFVQMILNYHIFATVLAQRRQKLNTRINEMTVSSLNRDFVVAIPGLLGKVLNYACSLPCTELLINLRFSLQFFI